MKLFCEFIDKYDLNDKIYDTSEFGHDGEDDNGKQFYEYEYCAKDSQFVKNMNEFLQTTAEKLGVELNELECSIDIDLYGKHSLKYWYEHYYEEIKNFDRIVECYGWNSIELEAYVVISYDKTTKKGKIKAKKIERIFTIDNVDNIRLWNINNFYEKMYKKYDAVKAIKKTMKEFNLSDSNIDVSFNI